MTWRELRDLVTVTFLIAWRNRFLWVLGVFVELSLGSLAPKGRSSPSLEAAFDQALGFLHLAPTPLNALMFLLAILLLVVAAAVAGGGLMHACVEIDQGYFVRLRHAVKAGWRVAWKLIGLGIVLVGVAFLAVLCATFLIRVMSPNNTAQAWYRSGTGNTGLTVSLSIPFILFAVFLSVLGRLARRHIVVRKVGVCASLAQGLRLIFSRPGAALALWATDLACALLFLALLLVCLGPVLVPVLVFRAQNGPSAITTTALAGLSAVVVVAVGAKGAFSSTLWTLGFLRLTRSGSGRP